MEHLAEGVSTLLKTIKENQSADGLSTIDLLVKDAVRITNSQHSKDYYRQKIEERGEVLFRAKLSELKYRIRTERIDDPARYFTAMMEDEDGARKTRSPKKENLSNLPVWAEENTIQYPICVLSKRYSKKEYELKYKDNAGVEHLWKIVARDERLPGPGARKVLRFLEKLFGRRQSNDGKVEFSLYQLKQEARLSGKDIMRESERLASMAIHHKETLFDKVTGKCALGIDGPVGIFKKLWIEGKLRKKDGLGNKYDRKHYEKGWVIFSDWYVQNYLKRYVHRLPEWILDLSPQASRLWELLSISKPDSENNVSIGYQWLCDRMPLKKERFPYHASRQLKGMCEELIRSGAVKSWKLDDSNSFWKLKVRISNGIKNGG